MSSTQSSLRAEQLARGCGVSWLRCLSRVADSCDSTYGSTITPAASMGRRVGATSGVGRGAI